MTRWKDVEPGDVLELKGREWRVTAVKRKPLRVTVERDGVEHTAEVEPKGKVMRVGVKPEPVIVAPADDDRNPWTTPRDQVEQRLKRLLGAELVGETSDAGGTWVVPPVDVTTVAAHLAIMHGIDPSGLELATLVEYHQNQHTSGAAMTEQHYHSEYRPKDTV